MSRRWKIWLITAAAVLFLLGNLYLVFKENSKVERTVFVENWRVVKTGDLRESVQTSGVISPSEKFTVYFDANNGMFKEFLVSVGDEVSSGTPLFEYVSSDLEKDRDRLESERNAIEEKIVSIEEHIDNLENYLLDLEAESTINDEENNSQALAVYDLEKEIYNKELERNLLENEADKYDDLLSALEEDSGSLTVKSDYEGIVKSINTSLQNPVITIISKNSVVKGILNEGQLVKVNTGMEARISSELLKESLKGQIGQIIPLPENEPSVDKKSEYPFTITLDAPQENLFQGSHVSVDITTQKAKNVPILPASTIKKEKSKKYIYVLNGAGKIEKRFVKTGLKAGTQAEIKDGAVKDELVATEFENMGKIDEQPFITPVKTSKIQMNSIKDLSRNEFIKYVLRGFLIK